jgi:hypothetical protein
MIELSQRSPEQKPVKTGNDSLNQALEPGSKLLHGVPPL